MRRITGKRKVGFNRPCRTAKLEMLFPTHGIFIDNVHALVFADTLERTANVVVMEVYNNANHIKMVYRVRRFSRFRRSHTKQICLYREGEFE